MDLPYSDAPFIKAYPAETTEAFLDGHVSAFAFFGGVPPSILQAGGRQDLRGRQARTDAGLAALGAAGAVS
jgi:transposase